MTTDPVNDPDLWWINDAARALDDQISDSAVHEKIRAHVLRSVRRGVPVATDDAGIEINTRALRLLVASAVRDAARGEVSAIEFDTKSRLLTAVRIEMIGQYGDQLAVSGDRIAEVVLGRLDELLGTSSTTAVDVHVRWTDLLPVLRQ